MEAILLKIAIWALPVIFAITVHEVSHGYVARLLGDSTAYMLGRLTLNPIKHIDLFGTIIIPAMLIIFTKGAFIFGWAKPVPVNSRNLKKPKRDMALVAAAGPLSNFAMAIAWAFFLKMGLLIAENGLAYGQLIAAMGTAGILVNLILGVLNLIPIPPLDGSRVLSSFLSPRLDYYYQKIEPFGFFILIGLMLAGVFQHIIGPPITFLIKVMTQVMNF